MCSSSAIFLFIANTPFCECADLQNKCPRCERPRSLLENAERQEAASQDRLNSKGLRNDESRRDSLRVESPTSRPVHCQGWV
jgi:hypothetical protein